MKNKPILQSIIKLLVGGFMAIIVAFTFTSIEQLTLGGKYDHAKLSIILAGTALVSFAVMFYVGKADASESQLEQLREERVTITKKIEDEKEPDIFHTIQLSLNELNQYYTINKGQATTSFRISIAAALTGLGVIIGVIILNLSIDKSIPLTYIAGVSGIILEFIGGAYFFMYKKSLEQVNFFFGQLIKVQDTMLAINLADGIKEDIKKIEMQEKIIVSLLERSLK